MSKENIQYSSHEIKAKTICVLGAGGFIGSHIVDRLIEIGNIRILAIDLSSEKIKDHLANPLLTFVKGDVHDEEILREFISQSDVVISLVALCNPSMYNTIPLDVIDVNFNKGLGVVRACSDYKKWLIHFSTSEIYGRTVGSFFSDTSITEDPTNYLIKEDETPLIMGPIHSQRWSYACAKQLLERMIYAYSFEKDLAFSIVRPFNFIGSKMDFIPGIDGEGIPRVLACFMEALMFKKPLKIVDKGTSRRCFTYIDDAVDAVMAMLSNPERAKNQAFNIGHPGNEVSIHELADKMISLYQALPDSDKSNSPSIDYVSSEDFYGRGYEDSDRRVPDISKATNLLGWTPRFALDEALKRAMVAYIDYYQTVEISS